MSIPAEAPLQPHTDQTSGSPAEAASNEAQAVEAFAALGLGAETMRAVRDLGYGEPTEIQRQTITQLLAGKDVIAQAPTGTGKTAAYGLPIVERLQPEDMFPQALIITPTRELAIQVAEALHTFGKYREMVTLPIYGGQPYDRQLRALKRGVQVVVGTPGRVLDHINRGTLDLSAIHTAVLDEADEMLDMGFIEDIESILGAMPETRQTALFSATIPARIARLAQQYLRDPERVSVAAREAVAPRVRQVYYEVPGPAKPEALSRILDLEEPESAIVFVRTRRDADEVSERLNGLGYLAQAIHGEINQSQRERALERFRNGHTQLLVATDVAARGLDIPDVSHVINYDLPLDAESYVHRIGRTGRAGRAGEALTLVTPRERRQLRTIEQAIHRTLERLRLPTPADVAARRRAAFREELLEILDGGQLDAYLAFVEDIAGERNPQEIAAAAFKMAAQARQASRPGRGGTFLEAPAASEAPAAMPEEAVEETRRRPGGAGRRGERGPGRGYATGPMARLFLRVGRRQGVRPADLVGAIANEAGIAGDDIGDIDLYDNFSFVEVPEDAADTVRTALNRTTIRGEAPRASLARPGDFDQTRASRDDGPRDDRGRDRDHWRNRGYEDERPPLRAPYAGRRGPSGSRRSPARSFGGRTNSGRQGPRGWR